MIEQEDRRSIRLQVAGSRKDRYAPHLDIIATTAEGGSAYRATNADEEKRLHVATV
jgi:hypothetical protein